MRVLVAGRNAKALATAAGTFSNDLTIETASTKAASIALLERAEFDLIVACETLGDGSGLEVLSHAAVNVPNTLRIFAARPSTLNLLKGELGLFGLFRTLPYPINFRKLWAAINLARSCYVETELRTQAQAPGVQHVVLESGWQTGESAGEVRAQAAPKVQVAAAGATARRTASAVVTARTGAAAKRSAVASASGAAVAEPAGARATAHTSAAVNSRAIARVAGGVATARAGTVSNSGAAAQAVRPSTQAQQPRQAAQARATATAQRTANAAATARRDARIPQSEAFKRALAKRNAAKLDANSHISAMEVLGAVQQPRQAGDKGERRREPAMSNDSLAQLARLATTRRPTYDSRGTPKGKKRAAIFVGSGVFAAATAAVLTFFMLNANNSIGRSSLPLVASIERSAPQKIFSWPTAPQQPAAITPSMRSEAPAPADLEVQAEAESDASAIEPGHPPPPQPNPPPGPSEPPSADSPGWVDE
jgi:hypothetical protein